MGKISRMAIFCMLSLHVIGQHASAHASNEREANHPDNNPSYSLNKVSFLQGLRTRNNNNTQKEEKPDDDNPELEEEEESDPEGDFFHHAEFNVLNKYSAKLNSHRVKLGESARVGRFVIRPLTCWKENNQRLYQESRMQLEIYRVVEAQNELKLIYSGWFSNRHSSLTDFTNDVIEILPIKCE
jgi:hypothetical protein